MRCLSVVVSAINITGITFRGGSSPNAVTSSLIQSAMSFFQDQVQSTQIFPKHDTLPKVKVKLMKSKEYGSVVNHSFPYKKIPCVAQRVPRYIIMKKLQFVRYHPSRDLFAENPPAFANGLLSKVHAQRQFQNFRLSQMDYKSQRQRNVRDTHFSDSSNAHSRHLLQLDSSTLAPLDPVSENDSGGCIQILSPESSIWIHFVGFIDCSSLYGGGAFINATNVIASNVAATNNIAKQGGGIFAVANSCSFNSCSFTKNTAVTASQSRFSYAQSSYSTGVFSKFPDVAAAMGAGLFVSALQHLRNCTFVDNLVIAGTIEGLGWNESTKTVSGFHALGSGAFALQTLPKAQISDIEFIRSKQLCGGPCVASGSFFIGLIADLNSFGRITFDSCETSAIASIMMDLSCSMSSTCSSYGISPALGAGISFYSSVASAAMASIQFEKITSKNCFVQSVGLAAGGALYSLQTSVRTHISNTIVENMTFKCYGRACNVRGAAIYINMASIINISITTVSFLALSCAGSNCKIQSGAIHIFQGNSVFITNTILSDTSAQSSGASSIVRGVCANFGSIVSSNIDGGVFRNLTLSCSGLGCLIAGGIFTVNSGQDISFSSLNFSSISAVCVGTSCKVFGSHVWLVNVIRAFVGKISCLDIFIQAENQIYGGVFLVLNGADLTVSEISLQSIAVKCGSAKCEVAGSLLHLNTNARVCVSRISISNVDSKLSAYSCIANCAVSFIRLDVSIDTSISEVNVSDSFISCDGNGCLIVGLVHMYSCQNCSANQLIFSNVSSVASGDGAASYGCLFIYQFTNSFISNMQIRNMFTLVSGEVKTLSAQSARSYGSCLYVRTASKSTISNIQMTNISTVVSGGFIGGGAIGFQSFLNSSLHNVAGENITIVCANPKCPAYKVGALLPITCLCRLSGGMMYFSLLNASLVRNIVSTRMSSKCFGHFCSVSGGSISIDVFLSSVIGELTVSRGVTGSSGNSSSASGASLFIILSDRSVIKEVCISSVSCNSNGSLSTATGAVITVLAGNLIVTDVTMFDVSVQCSGDFCNSFGGGFSVVSSLSKYDGIVAAYRGLYTPSNITLWRVSCHNASSSCIGINCLVSGAALSAKRSFRSTDILGLTSPFLVNEVPDVVRLNIFDSQFISCFIFSFSDNASISGAALSFSPAIVSIFNSSIHHSSIHNSHPSSFVAGGAIFTSEADSVIELVNVQMINNSVPSQGFGGALYLGAGTRALVSNCTLSKNSANRGGGIYVEAASLKLHSSTLNNNRAVDRGAAIFCASIDSQCSGANASCFGGSSSISVVSSMISGNTADFADSVGSSVFVAGAVALDIDKSTSVSVNVDPTHQTRVKRDQTGIYISAYAGRVSSPTTICESGTMLRIVPITSSSFAVSTGEPSNDAINTSNCFPLCIGSPQYRSFLVSQGMVTSCSPCPKDTYSLRASNSMADTADQFCDRSG